MCNKKTIHLICMILLLSTITTASAAIVGYYPMNEGSGSAVKDASGKGHDGTINGSVNWVQSKPGFGTALSFPGTAGNYVRAGTWDPSEGTGQVSVAAWIKWAGSTGNYQGIVTKCDGVFVAIRWQLTMSNTTSGIGFGFGGGAPVYPAPAPPIGQWEHVAFAHDGTTATMYINGVNTGTSAIALGTGTTALVSIGALALTAAGDSGFNGTIDEVYICNNALSAAEVAQVMQGAFASPYRSSSPNPPDASTDVFRDSIVSWTAGKDAVSHDVYLGMSLSDVESASKANPKGALAAAGQAAGEYDPPGHLELGRTYYWRVDEVNSANPNNPTKGNIWSFTAEPVSYAVKNVAATASGFIAGSGPENTINGSGLDANDLHSDVKETMWMVKRAATPSWIQYDFGRLYKLDQMWVWNFNFPNEGLLGFGVKNAAIEYSADGTNWMKLGDFDFNQGPGEAGYAHNTTISFGGVSAKQVKITVNSGWGTYGQYGLSEVRFLYIPVQAMYPSPASGVTGQAPDVALSWRPGRQAASHKVYMGTDPNVLTLAGTPTTNSFAPADLSLGTPYYWRVDEVNTAEAVSTWSGSVWSFTTNPYLVVDDMESYNDTTNKVFDTWVDGYGTSNNGSIVGLTTSANGTFGSTTIYHAGRQSMPLAYTNSVTVPNSEATRTFGTAQDWAAHGVKTLTLYFYGQGTNTTTIPFWVKLTDQNGKSAKVAFGAAAGEDPIVLADPAWTTWNIPLASFTGITLSKIKSMTIGLGNGTGSGTLYIDDIRLYPQTTPPAVVTSTLVGWWKLDNDVKDSSNNGNNGTITGAPTWGTGKIGSGLTLNGSADYVDCGAGASLNITDVVTLSAWIKPANFANSAYQTFVGKGDHAYDLQQTNGNVIQFYVYDGTWYSANSATVTSTMNGTWHHVAGTYDGAQLRLYVDGAIVTSLLRTGVIATTTYTVSIGRNSEATGRLFNGTIDDVRVYHGALPTSEIKKLANP